MKQLLEAGVHFGHQTRRWNPKMAQYIFTERNGIYIIDLQKTVKKMEEAYDFVKSAAVEGKEILFVGTKKQAQDSVKEEAIRCGMHYVSERWLGGMLTNFDTIRTRIQRLAELERMEQDGVAGDEQKDDARPHPGEKSAKYTMPKGKPLRRLERPCSRAKHHVGKEHAAHPDDGGEDMERDEQGCHAPRLSHDSALGVSVAKTSDDDQKFNRKTAPAR
jgi:hypothetical protein